MQKKGCRAESMAAAEKGRGTLSKSRPFGHRVAPTRPRHSTAERTLQQVYQHEALSGEQSKREGEKGGKEAHHGQLSVPAGTAL